MLLCFLAFSKVSIAQSIESRKSDSIDEEVFQVVEQHAEFPDGQAALFTWLSAHIKYPEEAKNNKVQGKVLLRFIVEKDGSITGVTVLRGRNELLDKEAVRVTESMPKWKPGKQRGKEVRSYFTLPIVFRLEDDVKKE